MPWNDGLLDEQIEASSHFGSHACLLAGPGTGKTLCLTRRILYLIGEEGIPPQSILALTFTRAAAAELKSRVRIELGEGSDLPIISTLHSFALRKLLQEFQGDRLPQPIRIADDFEERHIIQEDLKRLLGLRRVTDVRDLLNQLSSDWESLRAEDQAWARRFPNPRFLGAWREHRTIFGYLLRSELVYQLKRAIDEDEIQVFEQIRFLLVDEYQDLNACDLAVIRNVTNADVELYAAGDDDQSIYGFRYAHPEGIRHFGRDYDPSAQLYLQQCMRCDREILNLGLYVARLDYNRIEKELNCCDTAGDGVVNILRFNDQGIEATGIANLCHWLVNNEGIEPGEILILLRSDRNRLFSTPIRDALSNLDIPVETVSDPLAPLNKIEGRHFICLLRLICDSSDNLAWRSLLEVRNNRIGRVAISQLYEWARNNSLSFSDVLSTVESDPSLIPRQGPSIASEIRDIQTIINSIDEEETESLSTFISQFAEDQIEEETLRLEIIRLFQRILDEGEISELSQLLRAINVSLTDSEQEQETGSVNIMSMHQAKGLSADAVIILAAEDEYIPGRAIGDGEGDERRLLYVSLTRARHYLFMTHCLNRTGAQAHSGRTSGQTRRRLTRFLRGGPIDSQSGIQFLRNL
jgi:DNA helicase-2/ATP-dependent DNA helicase PcrA